MYPVLPPPPHEPSREAAVQVRTQPLGLWAAVQPGCAQQRGPVWLDLDTSARPGTWLSAQRILLHHPGRQDADFALGPGRERRGRCQGEADQLPAVERCPTGTRYQSSPPDALVTCRVLHAQACEHVHRDLSTIGIVLANVMETGSAWSSPPAIPRCSRIPMAAQCPTSSRSAAQSPAVAVLTTGQALPFRPALCPAVQGRWAKCR